MCHVSGQIIEIPSNRGMNRLSRGRLPNQHVGEQGVYQYCWQRPQKAVKKHIEAGIDQKWAQEETDGVKTAAYRLLSMAGRGARGQGFGQLILRLQWSMDRRKMTVTN